MNQTKFDLGNFLAKFNKNKIVVNHGNHPV